MDNATGKRILALVRSGDYAHPGEEEAIRLLLAGLAPDPHRRVLDAGCGSAGTAAWMQARGWGQVTGIEIDATTVALARERHPEVDVIEGDLRRAGAVLTGPFDLICAMTAVYAVTDQATVFGELGELAAPGAELRLLEYADPHGRFAAETGNARSRSWWRPLRPRELPELLAAAGWSRVEIRDLQPEFVLWYRRLGERIAAQRQAISRAFGREWYAFVAREYAEILAQVREGVLGGALVRARRPAGRNPSRACAR